MILQLFPAVLAGDLCVLVYIVIGIKLIFLGTVIMPQIIDFYDFTISTLNNNNSSV